MVMMAIERIGATIAGADRHDRPAVDDRDGRADPRRAVHGLDRGRDAAGARRHLAAGALACMKLRGRSHADRVRPKEVATMKTIARAPGCPASLLPSPAAVRASRRGPQLRRAARRAAARRRARQPGGPVWYTAQRQGALGRLDPATRQGRADPARRAARRRTA